MFIIVLGLMMLGGEPTVELTTLQLLGIDFLIILIMAGAGWVIYKLNGEYFSDIHDRH